MAKITVMAKKDVWYGTSPETHQLYKKDSVFEIEEKDFSDWHTIKYSVQGKVPFRGAHVKVEAKIVNGKIEFVEVKAEDKEVRPTDEQKAAFEAGRTGTKRGRPKKVKAAAEAAEPVSTDPI